MNPTGGAGACPAITHQEKIMATSKEDNTQIAGNKHSASRGRQGTGTSNRGFASMDPARQREIASEGGRAAHQKGTAHEFTSEEARRAGSLSHGNRQSAQQGGAKADGDADKRAPTARKTR
jgi:general stress protein YciG